MASTSRKRFNLNKRETETNEPATSKSSTPTRSSKYLNMHSDDYSPVFIPCTQEVMDKVDVLWDWNSPQSKQKYTRKKRVIKIPSPKLTLRKGPISNKYSAVDKLKKDLLSVHNEIRGSDGLNLDDRDLEFNNLDNDRIDIDTFFNDSIDEDLLLISQQIEDKFASSSVPKNNLNSTINNNDSKVETPRKLLHKSYSSNDLEESPIKHNNKQPSNFKFKLLKMENCVPDFDDSLDAAFNNINLPSISETNAKIETVKSTTTETDKSPLKLKTKSFSFGDHYNNARDKTLDVRADIERKRLIALAKLKAKKNPKEKDISPIKCSPDEIEEKRKQAMAKLEARKKQEVVERNRLEALKRLEMKRRMWAVNAPKK